MTPFYPNITVKLTGEDSNVFNLMGIITNAMRRNKVENDRINEFVGDCFNSESYDASLQLFMKWVNVT